MELKGSVLQWPADRPWTTRLILFLLGCVYTAAFAPFGWWLLLPVVMLPVLYVWLTVSPRDAGWLTFCFGFGIFLSGTYWIYISVVVFGEAPAWLALVLMFGLVLIMSAYFWLTGWLVSRLAQGEPWLLLIAAPTGWVTIEWLRGFLLTGFPWLAVGYSQIDSPLAGFAPLFGVYGVSLLTVLSAAAVLVAVFTAGPRRWIPLAIVILPWALGAVLRPVEWTEPDGPPVRTTLLQAGISQDQKWLPEVLRPTLTFYRNETLAARDSQIVLWPEVAIPAVDDRVEAFIGQLQADSRATGQTILFGILELDSDRGEQRVYNSIMLVDADKRQFYRKRHLVPFGEYFPVPDGVREWMRMRNLPHNDLSAGAEVQPLLVTAGGIPLASAICYEDAYGAEQLYALPEARVLINVSNDAWFGDSIAPHQHLQIARMRSLEAGRVTVRATNTGISAFIDHKGRILDAGAQFEPVTMTADVQTRRGATPYVNMGNFPVITFCLLVLAGFWLRRLTA